MIQKDNIIDRYKLVYWHKCLFYHRIFLSKEEGSSCIRNKGGKECETLYIADATEIDIKVFNYTSDNKATMKRAFYIEEINVFLPIFNPNLLNKILLLFIANLNTNKATKILFLLLPSLPPVNTV